MLRGSLFPPFVCVKRQHSHLPIYFSVRTYDPALENGNYFLFKVSISKIPFATKNYFV